MYYFVQNLLSTLRSLTDNENIIFKLFSFIAVLSKESRFLKQKCPFFKAELPSFKAEYAWVCETCPYLSTVSHSTFTLAHIPLCVKNSIMKST